MLFSKFLILQWVIFIPLNLYSRDLSEFMNRNKSTTDGSIWKLQSKFLQLKWNHLKKRKINV